MNPDSAEAGDGRMEAMIILITSKYALAGVLVVMEDTG